MPSWFPTGFSFIIQAMDLYSFIKTIHIISATILFGTGLGTAFFMFRWKKPRL